MNNIADNKIIYIPFLVFYNEHVVFAYNEYEEKDWSISHLIEHAYQSESFDLAKKAFSKCLRVLCPKEIWKHYGIIKTNANFLRNYIPYYQTEYICGKETYLKYSSFIKSFEVLDLDKNTIQTIQPVIYQQLSIFE